MRWDRALDENTDNPTKQTFEKMVSKMYLGEIVRRVLVNMIEKRLLFQVCFTEMEIRKTTVKMCFMISRAKTAMVCIERMHFLPTSYSRLRQIQ